VVVTVMPRLMKPEESKVELDLILLKGRAGVNNLRAIFRAYCECANARLSLSMEGTWLYIFFGCLPVTDLP
jgi:hypothetical protein